MNMHKYETCIAGYYGMKNSGDDALLAASVWGVQNYLNENKLTATTSSNIKVKGCSDIEGNIASKQKFRGQNRFQRYQLSLQSRRIIFGGGSVFHTAQDINIKRHMMRLSGGNDHRAVGVGLGPFKDTHAEKACQKFLHECQFIGVRDQRSFDIANELAPSANIDLTFDLAPLLLCNNNVPVKALPRRGIAVCLCPRERLTGDLVSEQRRIEALAKVLIDTWNETGEPIYFIDFNGHALLGDHQVHQELQRRIPASIPTRIVEYDENPFRLLQRLAGFNAVISMRLHGSILSYLVGTPVLSLGYHNKCKGWAECIGLPEAYRFKADNFDSDQMCNELVQGLSNGFIDNQLSVSDAISAAKNNWRKAS